MTELARDPSEQCRYLNERDERCLNQKAGDATGWLGERHNCRGPHRYTTVEPALARDSSEQCTFTESDGPLRVHCCLNKATHQLETHPPQPRCDGPHRFTATVEPEPALARDQPERCTHHGAGDDGITRRCVNQGWWDAGSLC